MVTGFLVMMVLWKLLLTIFVDFPRYLMKEILCIFMKMFLVALRMK